MKLSGIQRRQLKRLAAQLDGIEEGIAEIMLEMSSDEREALAELRDRTADLADDLRVTTN